MPCRSPYTALNSTRLSSAALVGVLLMAVVGCGVAESGAPRVEPSTVPEPGPGGVTAPTTDGVGADNAYSSLCGGTLPVSLQIPDAIGGAVSGPAEGAVIDGQIALHWRTNRGVFEVRWPPDPQPLFGSYDPSQLEISELANRFGGSSMVEGSGELVVRDDSSPMGRVTFVMNFLTDRNAWERPCERVEIREIDDNGETIRRIYQLGNPTGYEVPALVDEGAASEREGPPQTGFTMECRERRGAVASVVDGPAAQSPVEALRDFLASPEGEPLDLPNSPRIHNQYYAKSTDAYWFERYADWDQHLAVIVERVGDLWHATTWISGRC